MKIRTNDFRVREGKVVHLKKWPTEIKPVYASAEDYDAILNKQVSEMSRLQTLHYASNRNALLLIFQGMDAAGKDGTIKRVMSGVNPQGCNVSSFKHPTPTEVDHDFLWRTTRQLPERGQIGIFNRSYYEDVLITRVHPEILEGQGLSNDVHKLKGNSKLWQERFRSILDLEEHLHRNGTKIVKFFLHLSKNEQRRRFLSRIDNPEKNWKLTMADIKERTFWKEYQHAYEDCLAETSTKNSPWYIVPADDKKNARLITSKIIVEVLNRFKMEFPRADAKRVDELKEIRNQLETPD